MSNPIIYVPLICGFCLFALGLLTSGLDRVECFSAAAALFALAAAVK